MASLSRSFLVVLLLLIAVVSQDVVEIEGIDENKQLNQVQFIGTTNSYRVAPSDQIKYALVDIGGHGFGPPVDQLKDLFSYSHKNLTFQLDMGVRYFELRVYPDPQGGHYSNPKIFQEAQKRNITIQDIFDDTKFDQKIMDKEGFKVFHLPDYDFLSTCYLLKDCLQQMYNWSTNHQEDHLPIVITIEIMTQNNIFHEQNLTIPPQINNTISKLENEINEIMQDKIYRHNYTQNNNNNNNNQIEHKNPGHHSQGWPKISDLKNKFIFFVKKSSMPFSFVYYLSKKNQTGNNRVFYNAISPKDEQGILERDVGIVYIDDPSNGEDLQALVRGGYLVATRAESDLGYKSGGYLRDISFSSGAQFITTKYPKSADYGPGQNNYYVAFKEDQLVRNNPVDALVGTNQFQDFPDQYENSFMRMNQVQYIGTHNSYRINMTPDTWKIVSKFPKYDNDTKYIRPYQFRDFQYSHLDLSLQLDMGLRQLELDVYADTNGSTYSKPKIFDVAKQLNMSLQDYDYDPYKQMNLPGFKVMHVLDYDQNSHCYLLEQCLFELKSWSDQNSNHSFIFIMLQIQQISKPPENGTKPELFTSETLTQLDDLIREIFGPEKLIKPEDLMQNGTYNTVKEAIQEGKNVWPYLHSVRGKFMFGMIQYEDVYDMFTQQDEAHQNLAGRVIFPTAKPYQMENKTLNTDNIAWILYDDVFQQNNKSINEYAKEGYLVRTRVDLPGQEGIINDNTRKNAVFETGAHFLSCDYPLSPYYQQPRFSDYYVAFQNKSLMRKNNITCDDKCTPGSKPRDKTIFEEFSEEFSYVATEGEHFIEKTYQNIIGQENCQGFPGSQTGQYFLMIFIGIIYGILQCYCIRACARRDVQSDKKSDIRK